MKTVRFAACFLLILSIIMETAGCSKENKETAASEKELITYSSEGTGEETQEETEDTVSLTPETTETETEPSETESETEEESSSETETAENLVKFMGHGMDPYVAEVNRKTLENKGSGLFDLLGNASFTATEILQMAEGYKLPETAYLSGLETSEEKLQEISDYRNLQALKLKGNSMQELRYGILVSNADVRSFPTELTATDSTDLFAYDMFQESVLPTASGVLILHETVDGQWYFVQGENYYGWIQSVNVGICSYAAFSAYLITDRFLVVTTARANSSYGVFRMGTILPYTKKVNDEYMVMIPKRDGEGNFYYDLLPLPDDGSYHEGFLKRNLSDLQTLAEDLIGVAYGWGDTGNYYDCSSTVGLLYRCFGFYMPRNTSAMKYFGGNVTEVSGLTDEEKLALIETKPGAILIMPGHAMFYEGKTANPVSASDQEMIHRVIHNTKGYYENQEATTFISCYCVVASALENMYRANGELFLSCISYVLTFDEITADTAE